MIGEKAGHAGAETANGAQLAARAARAARAASAGRTDAPRPWRRPRLWPSLLVAGLVLAAVIAVAISQGPVRIPLHTVWQVLLQHVFGVRTGSVAAGSDSIIWRIRLPRVLLAGMVGAALSYSGATYQGVFRNPLADPYLIGVASGAGLGAAVAIISPLHASWHGLTLVPLFAFAGSMAAVTLSYTIARTGRAVQLMTLILAGVAISTLASAGMTFTFMLHNDKFFTIFSWLLGGFNSSNWQSCFLLPYVVITAAIILSFGRVLNVLQVGDDQAQQLGIPVERVKLLLLLAASLAAAAAVSVSGLIGFVGLIVPHVVRLIWGPDYRRLLPLSMVLGAAFLVLADLFARLVIAPQEVPIGIVTAFCGAPFFLFLLKRRQRLLM